MKTQELALEIILEESKDLGGEAMGLILASFLNAYDEHKRIYGSFKHLKGIEYNKKMDERAEYQLKEARKTILALRLKGYRC